MSTNVGDVWHVLQFVANGPVVALKSAAPRTADSVREPSAARWGLFFTGWSAAMNAANESRSASTPAFGFPSGS